MKSQGNKFQNKKINVPPYPQKGKRCLKYERHICKRRMNEYGECGGHIPFRASSSDDIDPNYWMIDQKHSFYTFIHQWFTKQVGRPFTKVFGSFMKFGWRSTNFAFYIWDDYVDNNFNPLHRNRKDYYYNCNGIFTPY